MGSNPNLCSTQYIQFTKPRKVFKKQFGQSNHFLITTLIGLDAILKHKVEKPEGFSTSWNPHNKDNTVNRSRVFILQSFLGNAVEALEMYLKLIRRNSNLLQISKLIDSNFDTIGNSTYSRSSFIGNATKTDPILIIFIEILICIRNSIFHYDANTKIKNDSAKILRDNSEKIKQEFCGLDINILISKLSDNSDYMKIDLCFKEVSSLINAMHKYVESIDKYIISKIKFEDYIYDAIQSKLINPKVLSKVKSFSAIRLQKYIRVTLQNDFCVPPEALKLHEDSLLIKLKKNGIIS